MTDSLPKTLAEFVSKGYVIAPAGYGKTHLIAQAVKEASNRQLILTHTFAGVNSIKTKMTALGVPSSNYQVDTIASWSLRLCLAYPKNSGWPTDNPTGDQWNNLYESCKTLLEKGFIRHVVSATYSGIYVDEYQDCNQFQHDLICVLGDFLPCRILGDPLQAIFDFADDPVDWEKHVYPNFTLLGKLETPWRWEKAGASELGAWLKDARATLESGNQINLNAKLPKGVNKIVTSANYLPNKQYSCLCAFLGNTNPLVDKTDTVIAIHSGHQQYKNKTHLLARTMGGKFSSIEEVEGKTLFTFITKLEKAKTSQAAFKLVIEFSKDCFTGVVGTLVAGTKRGEIAKQTSKTKYPDILNSANSYLTARSSKNLLEFFRHIRSNTETHVYRRDLFNRFLNILKIHIDGEATTLIESANFYQQQFRHTGRPLRHTKLIGTTLLIKGLEYDHAVVLEADSLSCKELYVAMTRGSKSLTFITSKTSLPAA